MCHHCRRRSAPSTAGACQPASFTLRQPSDSHSAGLRVAAGRDELQVLAVGHWTRGERKALEEHAVARRLVVEGESVARRTQRCTCRRGTRATSSGCSLRRAASAGCTVGRAQRIQRQQVLDVGEQQFLVLLLVVQPERDARHDVSASRCGSSRGDQLAHVLVHVRAVAVDVVHRRARQHAAQRPRKEGSDRLVVGVEQIAVLGWNGAIAGQQRARAENSRRTRWCARDATWPGCTPGALWIT